MNIAFYNAVVGAQQQQKRLDVISNNISNINTDGYRNQKATFTDMLYSNIHDRPDNITDLTVGSSARVEKTDIDFSQGLTTETGWKYDFAIKGSGFFAVYNYEQKKIYYTRKGNFSLGEFGDEGTFYLQTDNGEFVLDAQGQAIQVNPSDEEQKIAPGIYDFINYQGILSFGDELYQPSEKNGQPYISTEAELLSGSLEKSNSNLANEMTEVIKAQRSYQAELRMITTADQIIQTVNNLRN